MSVDDKITTITQWQIKNFPGNENSWHSLLGLQEELGELSHAYLKRAQGIRVNEKHDENIKDAVGDIFIYLLDFCRREGISFERCLDTAMDDVMKRDWEKNKVTGVMKESKEKAEGLNVSSLSKFNEKILRDKFRDILEYLQDSVKYENSMKSVELLRSLEVIEEAFWAHRGQLENIYDYASAKLEDKE